MLGCVFSRVGCVVAKAPGLSEVSFVPHDEKSTNLRTLVTVAVSKLESVKLEVGWLAGWAASPAV